MSLQGSIETIALADVMALLASSSKSGELRVVGSHIEGRLWLRGGLLVGSKVGRAHGHLDALFELLRLTEGNFVFKEGVDAPAPEEPAPVAPLVRQAEERLNEWRDIEAVVPSLEHRVRLIPDLPAPEVTLSAEQWRLVMATALAGTVHGVLEELGLGMFDGCRGLRQLVDAGLVIVDPPRVRSSASDPGRMGRRGFAANESPIPEDGESTPPGESLESLESMAALAAAAAAAVSASASEPGDAGSAARGLASEPVGSGAMGSGSGLVGPGHVGAGAGSEVSGSGAWSVTAASMGQPPMGPDAAGHSPAGPVSSVGPGGVGSGSAGSVGSGGAEGSTGRGSSDSASVGSAAESVGSGPDGLGSTWPGGLGAMGAALMGSGSMGTGPEGSAPMGSGGAGSASVTTGPAAVDPGVGGDQRSSPSTGEYGTISLLRPLPPPDEAAGGGAPPAAEAPERDPEGDSINRGLLLKFLSSVRS